MSEFKVGDRVRIICDLIPGTAKSCADLGIGVINSGPYGARYNGFGKDLPWYNVVFKTADAHLVSWEFQGYEHFVLEAEDHTMPEPEFSLEEIHEGQSLCSK